MLTDVINIWINCQFIQTSQGVDCMLSKKLARHVWRMAEYFVRNMGGICVSLTVSAIAVHFGHHMSTKDKECIVNAAKIVFGDLLICSYLIMVISTLF